MSSEILTDLVADSPSDFRLWHVYALLSMAAAAAAVWAARNTHPLALLLLSAAVLAAGFAALSAHRALVAFFSARREVEPLGDRAREGLQREKALLLRSIKELDFDHAMGKVGEADYTEMSARLRARTLALMQDLERAEQQTASERQASGARRPACPACRTRNDPDAKFCKNCGNPLTVTPMHRPA